MQTKSEISHTPTQCSPVLIVAFYAGAFFAWLKAVVTVPDPFATWTYDLPGKAVTMSERQGLFVLGLFYLCSNWVYCSPWRKTSAFARVSSLICGVLVSVSAVGMAVQWWLARG